MNKITSGFAAAAEPAAERKTVRRSAGRGSRKKPIDIHSVGEIRLLARLLKKSARSSDYENLLRDCLSIAEELEYVIDSVKVLPDVNEIRDIFSISQKGSAYILLKLLENPNCKFSYERISEDLGYSVGSCKVFVCNLRKNLMLFDLQDAISTCRLRGIYIAEADSDRVRQEFYRLSHWEIALSGTERH